MRSSKMVLTSIALSTIALAGLAHAADSQAVPQIHISETAPIAEVTDKYADQVVEIGSFLRSELSSGGTLDIGLFVNRNRVGSIDQAPLFERTKNGDLQKLDLRQQQSAISAVTVEINNSNLTNRITYTKTAGDVYTLWNTQNPKHLEALKAIRAVLDTKRLVLNEVQFHFKPSVIKQLSQFKKRTILDEAFYEKQLFQKPNEQMHVESREIHETLREALDILRYKADQKGRHLTDSEMLEILEEVRREQSSRSKAELKK